MSSDTIIYLVLVIGTILVSMTLHEAMHAFASHWLGDDTARLLGRLSLNPLKHIDPFLTIFLPVALAISGMPVFGGAKPVPFNLNNVRYGDWGAAIVAMAGPLTNFLIAFITFGVWALIGCPEKGIFAQVLSVAIYVNLGFFIFNLIPFPPLDGSRVLYALAPDFARRIMESIEQFGVMFIFIIMFLFSSYLGKFMQNSLIFFLDIFKVIFGV